MNYYQPRQLRGADGQALPLWHYTCQNGARIWPVGACAVGCPGHATADEAREHYRTYLLDTARYDRRMSGQQRHCAICGAWTDGIASAGPGDMLMHVMCDEHRTREHLATLIGLPGDMAASW